MRRQSGNYVCLKSDQSSAGNYPTIRSQCLIRYDSVTRDFKRQGIVLRSHRFILHVHYAHSEIALSTVADSGMVQRDRGGVRSSSQAALWTELLDTSLTLPLCGPSYWIRP